MMYVALILNIHGTVSLAIGVPVVSPGMEFLYFIGRLIWVIAV